MLDCVPSLLTFYLLCIFLFCCCSARHLSTCLTPGLSVHYSCISMCLTFILLHQTWDSLCLTSSFFLSPPPQKYIVLCSVSGFCFSPVFASSFFFFFKYYLPVFLSSLILLPCWFSFLLFCTFFFSAMLRCLSPSGLSVLFLLSSFHLPLSFFFPIEQLNLKDYRDILFSIIFLFTRACYYWNQQQASHTLPGELEGIRNICYLPNDGSLLVQSWSVYIRIKCRLQFESEPYAFPKLWIFIVK